MHLMAYNILNQCWELDFLSFPNRTFPGCKWNVGCSSKSAIAVFGATRLDQQTQSYDWRLSGIKVPFVKQYKYGGIVLSSSGSAAGQLAHMRKKAVPKTGQIVAWARINNIIASLLEKLWRMHVEFGVLFGFIDMRSSKSRRLARHGPGNAQHGATNRDCDHGATQPLSFNCVSGGIVAV